MRELRSKIALLSNCPQKIWERARSAMSGRSFIPVGPLHLNWSALQRLLGMLGLSTSAWEIIDVRIRERERAENLSMPLHCQSSCIFIGKTDLP